MQLLALVIIGLTVFLIFRGYQTQATLFLSGFSLLILTYLATHSTGRPVPGMETSPTGFFWFDLFALARDSFSKRVAGIGLIVMAAGGFSRYMSSISASTALVRLAVRPLSRIRNPYVVLALAYVVGQILNIFVPSAAGLAMLLLVAMYPTLVKLGLRPISVAAVIGTTACLDLGPASGGSNVAAEVSGLEPAIYFARYQLPVALMVIPAIAILHFFWQRHCDLTEAEPDTESLEQPAPESVETTRVPHAYALLPILPLGLLLVCSPLVMKRIHIDVVSAMLICLFVSIGCEAIRHRNLKTALAGIVHFFQGMGDIFAKVVTLIVAAECFATGVKATGLIDSALGLAERSGSGSLVMMILLVLLIGLTTLLTGSGNAALFSFANLVPAIAHPISAKTVSLILPSQLAAGLFRSMSPVAGVIIAVSSAANVSPFALVRRTAIPIIGGILIMLLGSILFG